jgi:hypothetical protein
MVEVTPADWGADYHRASVWSAKLSAVRLRASMIERIASPRLGTRARADALPAGNERVFFSRRIVRMRKSACRQQRSL